MKRGRQRQGTALLEGEARSFKALSSSSTSEFLLPLGTCHQGPGVTTEVWSLPTYLGEVVVPLEERVPGMGTGPGQQAEGQPSPPARHPQRAWGQGAGCAQCSLCLRPLQVGEPFPEAL